MLNMGGKMSAEDLEEMVKMAGGDGQINIEEFCQALCPPKPKWSGIDIETVFYLLNKV